MVYLAGHSADQYHQGKKLIAKIPVGAGDKVLDLGCGTGNLAVVLSELVGPEGKVVAVDPDEERIKIAKEVNS